MSTLTSHGRTIGQETRIPARRTAPPDGPGAHVRTALRTLLTAIDGIDPQTVAQDLAPLGKCKVGAYVSDLAAVLQQLTPLVGATADQADQFVGTNEAVVLVEDALRSAHFTLADLADDLSPLTA